MSIDDYTRRQVLLRGGALGAAISVSGFLAACGSSGSGTATGGVAEDLSKAEVPHLTWGVVGQSPAALDISTAWSYTQQTTASLGMQGLVGFDENLNLVPVLATKWSRVNPHQYVFTLRNGVKFWDGSDLTPEDVVFSLNRHFDPSFGSLINYFFASVGSVEAHGEDTIVIRMKQPDAVLPQAMALAPITSKKFAEELGDQFGAAGSKPTMLGTGPYVISSYTASNGAELERNRFYWGPAPRVAAASVKYFDTPQTMQLAMRSASLAGGFGFPLSEAEAWARVPNVATEYATENGLNSTFLSLNVEAEPWNDIHVRRAIAYSCDREGYVNAFVSGEGVPATSFVPPGLWANLATPNEITALYKDFPGYAFDLDRAKSELDKSAHPDGFSATVSFRTSAPQVGHALVSLSQALKQLGIDLKVKPEPENEWIAGVLSHKNLGIGSGVLTPDFVDPTDYMNPILLSENAVENGINTANFKNARVDSLLKKQGAAGSDRRRAQLLGSALKITEDELPYVSLWWDGPSVAVNSDYAYEGFNALYYSEPWLGFVGKTA